ncbi:DNA-binding domain-containing protein [Acinetobacter modestus]|uniref:HvfC family RiPP maturation protein n=1 Tax=Acinetobacter modestus TaxID=1776740 RepID=UPI003016EC94
MVLKVSTFQATQQQFCNWIREPSAERTKICDLDRMQIYRDLLFNNMCSFINLVYPIARSILPVDQWQLLLEEFFQKAKCQSPFYNDISLQFRDYLTENQHPVLSQYPWLEELLQFEWLELYLDTLEIEDINIVEKTSWQLRHKVWILVYQFPVYAWTVDTTLSDIELMPSAIMVWRDHQDKVRLERLSPLFAMLIEQMNLRIYSELELHDLIKLIAPTFSEQEITIQLNQLAATLTNLGLLNHPQNSNRK